MPSWELLIVGALGVLAVVWLIRRGGAVVRGEEGCGGACAACRAHPDAARKSAPCCCPPADSAEGAKES